MYPDYTDILKLRRAAAAPRPAPGSPATTRSGCASSAR